jgi:hypothetical protein
VGLEFVEALVEAIGQVVGLVIRGAGDKEPGEKRQP